MVSNDWLGTPQDNTAPQTVWNRYENGLNVGAGVDPNYYNSIPSPAASSMTVSTAGQQGLGSYNWNPEPIGSCYCTQSTHSFECKHMEKCFCGKASRVAPAALEMDVKGL